MSENESTAIVANHDPMVDYKDISFGFRKTKDAETGIETKRENINVRLPIPSVEGIVAILEAGGNELELLQSAVESTIYDYCRSLLNDDPKIDEDNFPFDKVTWHAIANLPTSDKRGRGIAKEVWEGFLDSYTEHMPAAIDRDPDVVKKQASHLSNRFQVLKTHERKNELLPKFIEMLTIYSNVAPDADEYSACVEFLVNKAEEYMEADVSADLADNLGF